MTRIIFPKKAINSNIDNFRYRESWSLKIIALKADWTEVLTTLTRNDQLITNLIPLLGQSDTKNTTYSYQFSTYVDNLYDSIFCPS